MQQGRFSTIRFNEWICVTAQYEKAVARLGRQVYQGYSKGLVVDFTSMEICKEIADTFSEAREIREDLEEELERDALDGLNVEEAKKADEHRKLTQAQKTQRTLKLKFTKLLGRQSINRSLAAHRDRVRELSRDLGLRALARYQEEPVLKVRGHKALCRLADRLNEDADKKWKEITESNKAGAGGLSFHTLLISFVGNFANFSKGTHVGKILLKFFKYDEVEEKEKLAKQYEGSHSEEALRAQMEEIDEPSLDVGREIDNMQQEYEETPREWSASTHDDWGDEEPKEDPAHQESNNSSLEWPVEEDSWGSDSVVDDDFLGVVSDADDDFLGAVEATSQNQSSSESQDDFPPAPSPAPTEPTIMRRRPEPEAESWLGGDSEPAADPQPSTLANVNSSSLTPPKQEETSDWGWGDSTDEGFGQDPFAPTPSIQRPEESSQKPDSDPDFTEEPDPFAEALALEQSKLPEEKPPAPPPAQIKEPDASSTIGVLSQPGGKRPPFAKPKEPEPASHWSQKPEEQTPPARFPDESDWSAASAPQKPEPPSEDFSLPPDTTQTQDPLSSDPLAASSEGVKSAQPALDSKQSPGLGEGDGSNSEESDPLLRLLKAEEAPPSTPKPQIEPDDFNLGDDLLPAFLRDRSDDDQSLETDSFIPELPSFLESEDGPNLEIVPFGSTGEKDSTKDGDQGDGDSFIPGMPE